ncbi:Transcription elongation factor spt6 [Podochytrium sp. JEL0797]|nr:Transcription elongation factor spt6 [Podochytrium sp. JEL0797]
MSDSDSDSSDLDRMDHNHAIDTTKETAGFIDSDDHDIDADIAAQVENAMQEGDNAGGGSDSEESGEDLDKEDEEPKKGKLTNKKKRIAADSDDSSDEDSDDEMTEADKGFIVDDDVVSEAGSADSDESLDAKRRRREERKLMKRKRRQEEEEDLDEEDLDLINENYGNKKKKKGGRLVRKGGVQEPVGDGYRAGSSSALDNIFDMDDEQLASTAAMPSSSKRDIYSDSDDEDGFVVSDEEKDPEDETEFDRKERMARAKEHRKADRQKARNLGQQYGISDEVWMDIQDLFGDGSDYAYALHPADGTKQRDSHRDEEEEDERRETVNKAVKLTDIYEPSEIAERLLTEEDEVIRLKDIPERFQLRPDHAPLSEQETARESTYIETHLLDTLPKSHPFHLASPTSRQTAVSKILKFLTEEHFEVPFIFGHRKDYLVLVDSDGQLVGSLDRGDLWKIVDADATFLTIETKRKTIKSLITDLRTSPDLLSSKPVQEVLLHDTYVDEMLRAAESVEDVADVGLYLQLYYSEEIKKVEEAKGRRRELKRAVRRSEYEEAKKNGIIEFVKMYGVNVQQFSESINSMRNLHVPEDLPSDPLDVAKTFILEKSAFSDEQRVVDVFEPPAAARMMLSQQISVDPMFRRFLRKVYGMDAVVTVTPTERGKTEITPLHPYYKFKYLKEKPVYKFDPTEYLPIHKAESEGLITVHVFVDEEVKLLEDVVKYITNDYMSEIAERWNDERRRCAVKATKELIFPAVVKWFKEMMVAKATAVLGEECRDALEKKIDVQPFHRVRNREDDYPSDTEETKTHSRVMAISWGDGDPQSAAFAICLDDSGRVANTTKLSSLHHRDLKAQDHALLLSKIREFQIEVIVVGGSSLSTRTRLAPDLAETIKRINDETEESDRDRRRYRRNDAFSAPELVVAEDDIARLVMNSKRYAKEFPDYPPLARYCVSLARRVQDTLLEFATLWNSEDEIRMLRIHSLQHLLAEDKLKSAFERAFINVVNMNGVDVNDAAAFPHRAGVLQFVSGLGPRKAGFVINRITKSGGKLESRPDLIHKKMLGRVIFMNASSFLKIHRKHFKRTNAHLDVLDNTRIHPEDYDIARKMAAGALDIDDVVEADDPSSHVAELMDDHPERLNNLMLDDFADELYRTSGDLKRLTLREIKDEIISPYKDRRARFTGAALPEIFAMLTGENPDNLQGMVVSCQVVKNFDRFFRCRLTTNQLDANLQLTMSPTTRVLNEGDTFEAAVSKVDLEGFRVELDAREEMVDSGKWLMDVANRVRDRYFSLDREEEDKQRKAAAAVPKVPKKPKRSRTVNHPYWKNVSYQEAVDQLTGANVKLGSLIIRPSTKGNDHICITWKVDEGVFQHIDILETNKENEWTLGKTLVIDGKKFDDLEEIIATYIEPMARFFSEARKSPKYRNDNLDDTFRWVEREVQSKKRSSYAVIACPEKSQCLYLVFQHIDKSPRHEYISVTPAGFKFRNGVYNRLERMFDAFKAQEAERMGRAAKAAAEAKKQQQMAAQQGARGYPSSGGGVGGGGSYPSSRGPAGMAMPPRPQAPSATSSGGRMPQGGAGIPGAVPGAYGQPQQYQQQPSGQPGWPARPPMPSQYPPQQQQQQYPPQMMQQQQQQQMGYRPQAPATQQYPPQQQQQGGYYGAR